MYSNELGKGRNPIVNSSQTVENDYLDAIILRFNDQWDRCEYPPRLSTYLNKAHQHDRSRLARELVLIDIEYRCRKGNRKSFVSYINEYPEILEDKKYFPDKLILILFQLSWEWYHAAQKDRLPPQIREYVLNKETIKKSSDLFWKLTKIDFDCQPESSSCSKLGHYAELFQDIFKSAPVVPIEMVRNQFQYDWKCKKAPEIDTYIKNIFRQKSGPTISKRRIN